MYTQRNLSVPSNLLSGAEPQSTLIASSKGIRVFAFLHRTVRLRFCIFLSHSIHTRLHALDDLTGRDVVQGNDKRSRYGNPKSKFESKRDVASRPRTEPQILRSRRSAVTTAKPRKGYL